MKEISLYIHIPFCVKKCLYCDFSSYSGKEKSMSDYIDALIKELLEKCVNYKIASIFIGGGTPTHLDALNLKKLLEAVNKLKFSPECEFTVECNPGTITEEKLALMKKYNVNRLSIGLQSTNNRLLNKIGRIHSFEEFKENYGMARKAGFNNINTDLMFGLPDQSLEDWKETLSNVTTLNPEHISAYSLIIEEGTPFYSMYEKDMLNLPDEDTEREMYKEAVKILKEAGYHQYEISNFAKRNCECYHNKIYWQCREYIGIGASASSFINEKRFKNTDNIKDYITGINNNREVKEEIYLNTAEDDMEEFMFMGLRMTEGISIKEFSRRFNRDIFEIYKKPIEDNIKKGLLKISEDRIMLTYHGIEVSNYVMSDFILK